MEESEILTEALNRAETKKEHEDQFVIAIILSTQSNASFPN